MRVNPISLNYQKIYISNSNRKVCCSQPNFEGKHSSAKFLGGLFGAIATAGAIGGTIIMSGGVALPFVLGYGALGAASGAFLGHQIDKGSNKNLDKQA